MSFLGPGMRTGYENTHYKGAITSHEIQKS